MIEIVDLFKHYGSVEAVRGLNLTVPQGEVFCFLGPNGAGKTTTIKILTGLMRPTRGTARIGGIDVRESPLAAKKLMGYIPDMPYLYDRLTVEETFRFTGDLYNVAPELVTARLAEYFEMFGLLEHRNMLVRELSHGMRQRLIYACTFLHDPSVLFVDEPLIGLDPYTIRLIKDLLRTKARAGMTVFLTTHILALAEDIGDRIGIIREGQLCALGSLAELRQAHDGIGLEDIFLKLTRPAVERR
ncbi:MAG: ABC transporter ATP-binding protein [Verrucomicrobia bacterium]|nr:ABC transporter ATP-binding protein [Verrucomicrobiota bacterium]